MPTVRVEISRMMGALRRARWAILTIAITHLIAVTTGMVMVHTGNPFALSYRDRLVARAVASDPTVRAYRQGSGLRAALIETARTQWACMATGFTGLSVIPTYLISLYRGWVGGIVSVDSSHLSRLRETREAIYYLSVVILQLIPYSLAAGAGVNLGLSYFRPRTDYSGAKWLGYPKEAIWDLVRVCVLIIPFVIVANFWEFLSPLNR